MVLVAESLEIEIPSFRHSVRGRAEQASSPPDIKQRGAREAKQNRLEGPRSAQSRCPRRSDQLGDVRVLIHPGKRAPCDTVEPLILLSLSHAPA